MELQERIHSREQTVDDVDVLRGAGHRVVLHLEVDRHDLSDRPPGDGRVYEVIPIGDDVSEFRAVTYRSVVDKYFVYVFFEHLAECKGSVTRPVFIRLHLSICRSHRRIHRVLHSHYYIS